jgi:hypothetical protein
VTRCPHCGGAVRREPARTVCVACGRGIDLTDVTAREVRLQAKLDYALRCRSAEGQAMNRSEEHDAGAAARRGPVKYSGV